VHSIVRLDDEDIEAIAERVVAKLRPARVGLVDAKELARTLGVERGWVYAHADALGAVRLGAGSRARLRFDVERALNAARDLSRPQTTPTQPQRFRPSKRPEDALPEGVELIRPRRGLRRAD
jgi:hypothetical protein